MSYSNYLKNSSNSNKLEKALYDMDTNAYRSYKISNDYTLKRSNTPNRSSSLQNIFASNIPLTDLIRKKYDPMKIPFGYKSKRFNYTKTDNNYLDGNQKKYFPLKRNKSFNFIDMMTPLKEEEKKFKFSKRVHIEKKSDSSRTIYPDRNKTEEDAKGKRQFNKGDSVGGIKNFLDNTPNNPKVRPRNLKGKENNVFSEMYYNDTSYKRQKSPVNWGNFMKRGDVAGNIGIQGHGITSYSQFYTHNNNGINIDTNNYNTCDSNINYSRRTKIMANMSDIFNVKKTPNINKLNGSRLKKELTYCFEEEQKHY